MAVQTDTCFELKNKKSNILKYPNGKGISRVWCSQPRLVGVRFPPLKYSKVYKITKYKRTTPPKRRRWSIFLCFQLENRFSATILPQIHNFSFFFFVFLKITTSYFFLYILSTFSFFISCSSYLCAE